MLCLYSLTMDKQFWILQRIFKEETPPIVIKEGLYKIGRCPESNILCKSHWVSRFHCDVIVRDGLVFIKDIGSMNGTFLEESQILKNRDIQLKDGDVISLGLPFSGGDPDSHHYVYKLVACKIPQEPSNRKRKASSPPGEEVSEKEGSQSPKRKRNSVEKGLSDVSGEKCPSLRRPSNEQIVNQITQEDLPSVYQRLSASTSDISASNRVNPEECQSSSLSSSEPVNIQVNQEDSPSVHNQLLASTAPDMALRRSDSEERQQSRQDTSELSANQINNECGPPVYHQPSTSTLSDSLSSLSAKPTVYIDLTDELTSKGKCVNGILAPKGSTSPDSTNVNDNPEERLLKTMKELIRIQGSDKILKTLEIVISEKKKNNPTDELSVQSRSSIESGCSKENNLSNIVCNELSGLDGIPNNFVERTNTVLSTTQANSPTKKNVLNISTDVSHECKTSYKSREPSDSQLNEPDSVVISSDLVNNIQDETSFSLNSKCDSNMSKGKTLTADPKMSIELVRKEPKQNVCTKEAESTYKSALRDLGVLVLDNVECETLFSPDENKLVQLPNSKDVSEKQKEQEITVVHERSSRTGDNFGENVSRQTNDNKGTINLSDEEIAFSQDVDGLVEVDNELDYSQLFLELEGEKLMEITEENINVDKKVNIKEEFFYDPTEENADIDLFQSHFSQCSQGQETVCKGEIYGSNEDLVVISSEDDISGDELPIPEDRVVKTQNLPIIHDFKVKLKQLDVETLPISELDSVNSITGTERSSVCSGKENDGPSTVLHISEVINVDKLEIISDKSDLREGALDLIRKSESIEPYNKPRSPIKNYTHDISSTKIFKLDASKEINECEKDIISKKKNSITPEGASDSSKNKTKETSHNKKKIKMKNDESYIASNDINVEFQKKQNNFSCVNKMNSRKDMTDSSCIKHNETIKQPDETGGLSLIIHSKDLNFAKASAVSADIASKAITLPPPDTISKAKLVKSTLLSKPPTEGKKRGRPKRKETSVTKERITKERQKKIAEERKARLKTLALEAKSKLKVDNNNKVSKACNEVLKTSSEGNKKPNVSINQHKNHPSHKNSEKEQKRKSTDSKPHTDKHGPKEILDDANVTKSSLVAKITERNRSSILLEGLMEAPERKARAKRKIEKANTLQPCSLVNEVVHSEQSKTEKTGCSKSDTTENQLISITKSCLIKSMPNVIRPRSKNKVTFNNNVDIRVFECEGMMKSVNELGHKDKAPSSPISKAFRPSDAITTLEETFFDIVHWNASWITEIKELPGEPPVYSEKYNAKDTYVSYKDYKRWAYPLMIYELWGNMVKNMNDEDFSKTGRVFDGIVLQCLPFGVHTVNGKSLLLLKCFFPLFGKQAANIVDPMDILLIKALSSCEGKRICFVLFGLVYSSVKLNSVRDISDPVARHYLATLNKSPNVCAYFDIIVYKSQKKEMSIGFQLRIRPAYNMLTEIRQFESLMKLATSPVSPIIIDPLKNSSVFLQKDQLDNKIITKYPLNEEQKNAILCTTQSVFSHKPSISIIHGPPGTGKTQVIVGIVEQLLYRLKLKHNVMNKKILICSQSNAAIDEICLRLLDIRQQLPREKRFKLTRFGRSDKIHPRVLEIHTAKLAQKQVDKRNLKEDIKLELDLHRATERMIATALEKPDSPNIPNYKKKYEKIQKLIASLEALADNTSTVEAQNKELEKLIFDEEMKVIYHSDIIATTLGSCSQRKIMKAFSDLSRSSDDRREIAVCIVDEATQATEVDILLPLVYDVKNFILVGDPQQLPPYVVSQTAKKCGLGQSLFSRLYKVWNGKPNAPVYLLTAQHRMHPDIAHFPSKHFYGGNLTTPSFLAINRPFKPYSIITHKFEQKSGETNAKEADVVVELSEKLLSDPNMKGFSIGLIVPYQKQRGLILDLIRDRKLTKQLSVNTIDSYQGQEKDIILLSCVRTSGVGFLNDHQRMNVALTRAKKAMYVIGNFVSLQSANIWKELLEDAKERNLHLALGNSGKTSDIIEFLFGRNQRKSRTSNS